MERISGIRPMRGFPHTRKLEDSSWEFIWAPYDDTTHQSVLDMIDSNEIILEIGAGDLRLAVKMAQIAKKVYAIEFHEEIILNAWSADGEFRPPNLLPLCGDARFVPFPKDITTAVLLMRHCNHFSYYLEKLRGVGCVKLITNARWRFGVELIDLIISPIPFKDLEMGWYACSCGATGFQTGPAILLTKSTLDTIHEVQDCPACQGNEAFSASGFQTLKH